jgi:hypothetical protein
MLTLDQKLVRMSLVTHIREEKKERNHFDAMIEHNPFGRNPSIIDPCVKVTQVNRTSQTPSLGFVHLGQSRPSKLSGSQVQDLRACIAPHLLSTKRRPGVGTAAQADAFWKKS